MKQKVLSTWLKGAVVCMAIFGFVVYGMIIPAYGCSIAVSNPEYAHCYWPWLFFLLCTAVPCYAALVIGWKIFTDIGRDRSFTEENARRMRWVSNLAFGDVILFFCGNTLLLFFNMSHPGIFLIALLPDMVGVAIAVCAAALSHLIYKSAQLQEDADLTI